MQSLASPVILIRKLVVERGQHRVIHELDLSVPAGSVYALLGGNGAGKTTTLNTLLGFIQPVSGVVTINGVDALASGAQRPNLAYLPENVALYPYMSGLENLRYFCLLAGINPSKQEANALLLELGLDAQFHGKRVETYSKGMRQKVGLAIAHARQASAMLLDEPTSGLDPGAANDFAQRIKAASASGMAILMATHDLFNAKQVADRIGIMKEGRLVEEFEAHTVDHDELEQKYLAHTRGIA
ncbi:putative ABC transporter ATP-binding protein YxlF [compost metagenome]